MNITIIANGLFPEGEWVDGILQQSDRIVCCDGALEKYLEWKRRRASAGNDKSITVIGDGDSLREDVVEQATALGVEVKRVRVAEQDDNDLTKAFHLALTMDPGRITIVGATGKREDHTLGNVSLLLDYAREASCPVEMLTDYGRFEAIFDTAALPSMPGQQISIFSFDNSLKITSAGLKYPTDEVRFDTLWKATLNEALSDTFTLTLSHPSGVLLFFADHL